MNQNPALCFHCMSQLITREDVCPFCGYDNHVRHNGPGMLGETVLHGQYLVGRVLGRGGFGVTYIGYDLNLKRRIAIKEYYPGQLVARESGRYTLSAVTGCEDDYRRGCQRALRESQVAANLGHIYGVVQVYNVFTTNNTVYIIMEYIEGQTLSKLVETRKDRLTIQEAMRILEPVASALKTLHRRSVIHRDVKPDNIMIRSETDDGVLLDFGAARVLDGGTMSTSSSVVSQGYAPPEQYNLSSLDGRIDQYALAATLYFVLTGIRPADVLQRMAQPGSLPSIRSKNPVVTPVVENVIMKGMSLRVQDRYPVVEDFWGALQKAATQTRNTHFTWKKAIALALSVTLAAGALAYFVPKWTSAPTLAPEVTEAPLPTPQQAMLPANDPSAPPTDEPAVTTAPEEMPAPFAAGDYLCQQLPDGTLAITGYQGSESQLTIPDTLDGLPVRQIAASAFENNQTIQSVTLPEGLTQLSFAAFQNCASLTDITFPSTLTTIEDQAFEGCVRLQSAHLPEGITHVGSRTFRNCTALTDVELRDSQGSIHAQTFDGCTSLEILPIPGYINEIHPTAFDNCPNLCLLVHMSTCGEFFARENRIPHSYNQEDYATEGCFAYSFQENDTIRIDKCIDESDFVLIPHQLEGKDIGAIAENAFSNNEQLIYVNIPETINELKSGCFSHCTALETVHLPLSGSVDIQSNVFDGCTSLRNITLTDAVDKISSAAFRNCTSLQSISIPEGITNLYDNTFAGCTNLEMVAIPASMRLIMNSAFSGCDKLNLVVYPGTYGETYAQQQNIPYTYAEGPVPASEPEPEPVFGSINILYVDTADNAILLQETISDLPVGDYSYTPDRAGEIEGYELLSSDPQSASILEDGSASNDIVFQMQKIPVYGSITIFYIDIADNSVLLQDTISDLPVGDYSYTPDRAGEIEGYELVNADPQTASILEDGSASNNLVFKMQKIPVYGSITIFYIDIADNSVLLQDTIPDLPVGDYSYTPDRAGEIEGYELVNADPQTASILEDGSASNNLVFKMQKIPNPEADYSYQLHSDGTGTITGYHGNETHLIIPDTLEGQPVTQIGQKAFQNNTTIESVTVPEGIHQLSLSAFHGCTQLQSVMLPSTLTILENQVFSDCTSLTAIHLPEGVVRLGSRCFQNCTALAEVTLPSTIDTIGVRTFDNCTSLREILIPAEVNKIANSAFDGCPDIQLLVYPGTPAEQFALERGFAHSYPQDMYTPAEAFVYQDRNSESVEIVRYTGNDTHVVIPPQLDGKDVYMISDQAFAANTHIQYVSIPSTVKIVGKNAFLNCNSLVEIALPKDVESSIFIGNHAFKGCTNLTELLLPNSVGFIGEGAFQGCTRLVYASIPESVNTLNANTFSGCTNLELVTTPPSLTYIDPTAFTGCPTVDLEIFPGSAAAAFAYKHDLYIRVHPDAWTPGSQLEYEPVNEDAAALSGYNGDQEILVLPESIDGRWLYRIDIGALQGNQTITHVYMTDSVTEIAALAFADCTNLKTIWLPGSIRIYEDNAFSNCTSLTHAALYNAETLFSCVFQGCTSLEEVFLPDTITAIGDNCFDGCPNVTLIVYEGSVAHRYAQENQLNYRLLD